MLAYHDFKKCLGKKINKEYIILVDTINPTCLVTAAKIKEQYIPRIRICAMDAKRTQNGSTRQAGKAAAKSAVFSLLSPGTSLKSHRKML